MEPGAGSCPMACAWFDISWEQYQVCLFLTISSTTGEVASSDRALAQHRNYQVSLSEGLYEFLHSLWEKEAPIRELS